MRTLALLALLLFIPVAIATAAVTAGDDPIPGASGTVWVTERTPGSSSVAAFDAATGAVLGWTPVGSTPIGVVVPHGSAYAYSSDEAADQMSVISRDEIRVVATIPMGAASKPHHLMASPNGKLIYVAEYNHNVVGLVDTARNENVEDFVASRNTLAKTHAVWITGDGKDLYTTNEGATQTSERHALEARRPHRPAALGDPDRDPPERGAGDEGPEDRVRVRPERQRGPDRRRQWRRAGARPGSSRSERSRTRCSSPTTATRSSSGSAGHRSSRSWTPRRWR